MRVAFILDLSQDPDDLVFAESMPFLLFCSFQGLRTSLFNCPLSGGYAKASVIGTRSAQGIEA